MEKSTIVEIAQALREYSGLDYNTLTDSEPAAFNNFCVARLGDYIYKIDSDSIKKIRSYDRNTEEYIDTIRVTVEVYHIIHGRVMTFDIEGKSLQWLAGEFDGITALF